MKSISLFAICIVSLFSCTNSRRIFKNEGEISTITLHEGQWYSNFKNEVFIRCIEQLYPKKLSKMVDSLDASHAANLDQLDYNTQIEKIADSLAVSFIKRNEAMWKIENRNVTLNVCIGYRNSEELDHFVALLYKKYHVRKIKEE